MTASYIGYTSETTEVDISSGSATQNFSLAVDRNKLKRILREIVRKHSKEMLSFGGGWFMFIYSSEKVTSFLDIEKDLKLLVKNIA